MDADRALDEGRMQRGGREIKESGVRSWESASGREWVEQTEDKLTQAPDVSQSDPAVDPARIGVGKRGWVGEQRRMHHT